MESMGGPHSEVGQVREFQSKELRVFKKDEGTKSGNVNGEPGECLIRAANA